MNFLAHLYLSGDSEEVAIGNFISDFVKGKEYVHYPDEIRKGILLHRKIDGFTDTHPIVRKSKTYFALHYRKYAGVITDVLFDYFLVNDWKKYSNDDFDAYVADVHNLLKNYDQYLPASVREFVPYFIRNNWLKSYGTFEGLESVFIGLSKGTSLPHESAFAMKMIHLHYRELHKQFSEFFPQLIAYVEAQTEEMALQ